MKFAIIIDDGYGDSATPVISEALAKAGPVEVLNVSDLIASAGYHFKPTTGFLAHDPKRQTRDLSDLWIVNRVVEIGSVATAKLDDNARVLHPNVVLGTYSRIISKAAKVFDPLERFPACQVLPINMQWNSLRRAGVNVKTPAFGYGMSAVPPDTSSFSNPVRKDPFDTFNWRQRELSQLPTSSVFVVDRPAGRPLIAYFTGSASGCFSLVPGEEVPEPVREKVDVMTGEVATALAAFMGEFLLFENEGDLTFGAFSRYLRTSSGDPNFATVVERGFAAELSAV